MSTPIALQLYSVRDELDRDFAGTLEQIKMMGYTAVETGQFAGDVQRQVALFNDLGLQVMAAHVKPPVGENKEQSLDFVDALGIETLVVPWLDPQEYYQSEDDIWRAADLLNEAAANARERGLLAHYHNHDFEFARINGRLAFDILLEKLDPTILFEIDTYWVQTAGSDAAELVQRLGSRAPLLHIKDGPLLGDQPMVAVGDGKMNFGKVIPAGEPHTKWLIVELDRCAGDMMQAVAGSYTYLSEFESGQV